MSAYAIECEALSKIYKRGKFAVRELNLQIAPRQVYGFLGQNGAGKTTTIRLLLDLIRPSQGWARIMGQNVRRNPAALRLVGALVEGANFYPYLTAWDNLLVLARTYGMVDSERIQRLLEIMGLAAHTRQPVGSFSSGMKQRLSIAAALLHDPPIIILDEPTNGLDPGGIHEMRGFIRGLVDEHGKTVFLSSHLLGEVQQICDRVAIIHQGQLVIEGTVPEILAERESSQFTLELNPLQAAQAALQERWPVTPGETPETLVISAPRQDIPAVVKALVAADVNLFGIRQHINSLEERFLELTRAEGN